MLKSVPFATALLGVALVVAGTELTCPDYVGSINLFAPESLPSNCSSVQNCTSRKCDCLSQTYDDQAVTCTGSTQNVNCDLAYHCFVEFESCLLTNGAVDDCGEWSQLLKDGYVEFLLSDIFTYNNTAIYSSCANAACHFLNDTQASCLDEWVPSDTCFIANTENESAQVTQSPLGSGTTPVPKAPGGKYYEDVKVIVARLKFGGDFSSIFAQGNTSAKAQSMAAKLKVIIEAFLKYQVEIRGLWEGSLISEFLAAVPAGDSALLNKIAANIEAMSSGAGGAKWYKELEDECKASGGCPFGITSCISTVLAITFVAGIGGGGGGGGGGTTESTCETRCIAFIVIGIVVTITVIIASLLIYKHRADSDRRVDCSPDKTADQQGKAANPLEA